MVPIWLPISKLNKPLQIRKEQKPANTLTNINIITTITIVYQLITCRISTIRTTTTYAYDRLLTTITKKGECSQ